MFGVNPADEVEGLLFIYCKYQADQKPGKCNRYNYSLQHSKYPLTTHQISMNKGSITFCYKKINL